MTDQESEAPHSRVAAHTRAGRPPGPWFRPQVSAWDMRVWCRRHFAALSAAVLLLTAFNLTFRLGQEVVTEWDESLDATSATEMVQSDEWVAPTFHGSIDYYNSKPPLNIWLVALSLKAFGQSLWALRLTSVLAAPAQYRSGFTARHVAATALLLALFVTEGRLVSYSYHYRDVSRSVQGVLLAEADPMIGQRVFGIGWSRADGFVAKALARAEPVHLSDLDSFWRESRAGDYLVSRDALQDVRLSTVQSNSRSYLHRRQQ